MRGIKNIKYVYGRITICYITILVGLVMRYHTTAKNMIFLQNTHNKIKKFVGHPTDNINLCRGYKRAYYRFAVRRFANPKAATTSSNIWCLYCCQVPCPNTQFGEPCFQILYPDRLLFRLTHRWFLSRRTDLILVVVLNPSPVYLRLAKKS